MFLVFHAASVYGLHVFTWIQNVSLSLYILLQLLHVHGLHVFTWLQNMSLSHYILLQILQVFIHYFRFGFESVYFVAILHVYYKLVHYVFKLHTCKLLVCLVYFMLHLYMVFMFNMMPKHELESVYSVATIAGVL